MKKYILSLMMLISGVGVFAQNSLVNRAEGYIRLNELDKAQETITEALNSGKTKNLAKAWHIQGQIYQKLFIPELDKAGIRQDLDTAKYIKNLNLAIEAYDKCYEFDAKQEYTEENKQKMQQFRNFVFYAGVFDFQNANYEGSFNHFDAWMKYPTSHPIVLNDPSFADGKVTTVPEVAYYASMSAFNLNDYKKMLKYMEEALKYEKGADVERFYLKGLIETGDTAKWIEVSKQYAGKNETVAYDLVAYYLNKGDRAATTALAEELLTAEPNNKWAIYAKGAVNFDDKKYEEALPFFERCIALDDTFFEAYYYAGACNTNMGMDFNNIRETRTYKTKAEADKDLEKVRDYYRKAEPYFLKLRELKPEDPSRWAYNLKTVYYIIGDKEKEAEMDALVK